MKFYEYDFLKEQRSHFWLFDHRIYVLAGSDVRFGDCHYC